MMYVWMDETTGEVSFSGYPVDHPDYENNHVTLCEVRGGKVNKHGSLMNIVTNVLRDAGVKFEVE